MSSSSMSPVPLTEMAEARGYLRTGHTALPTGLLGALVDIAICAVLSSLSVCLFPGLLIPHLLVCSLLVFQET